MADLRSAIKTAEATLKRIDALTVAAKPGLETLSAPKPCPKPIAWCATCANSPAAWAPLRPSSMKTRRGR